MSSSPQIGDLSAYVSRGTSQKRGNLRKPYDIHSGNGRFLVDHVVSRGTWTGVCDESVAFHVKRLLLSKLARRSYFDVGCARFEGDKAF